jgi:hypothetical protein
MRIMVATTILALGCCGERKNIDGDGEAADYADAFLDQYCSKALECRSSSYPTFLPTFESLFGATFEDCRRHIISSGELQAAVDEGRVEFDGTAGAACLAELDGYSCADYWEALSISGQYPQSCQMAITGDVPGGGACTLNIGCEMESICVAGRCEGDPSLALGNLHFTWTIDGVAAPAGCPVDPPMSIVPIVSTSGPPGSSPLNLPANPCSEGSLDVLGLPVGIWQITGGLADMNLANIIATDQRTVEVSAGATVDVVFEFVTTN